MFKIGSLCTGYGGLDMAVEAYFNAETVWTSDIDKYASIVIKERIGKPNLGDLKAIDWTQVEPIDILTAGYPCQPFSHAGQRKGTEDERHIFPYIMQAIGILRPRIIVLENVRGHLSLGFKEVLQRLAEAGYDAKWSIVRASDAGAPHERARLFVIAYPNSYAHTESRRTHPNIYGSSSEIVNRSDWNVHGSCSPIATDTTSKRPQGSIKTRFGHEQSCATDCNTHDQYQPHHGQVQELGRRFATRCEMRLRRAPNPLDLGKLNARFVEYMMGLPEGWVTDLPISRSQQLKILGNGVVPQQAYLALQLLCDTPKIERDL